MGDDAGCVFRDDMDLNPKVDVTILVISAK